MNILHLSRTMGQGGAEKVVVDICQNTKSDFDNIVVLSSGGINVKKLEQSGIYHEIIPDLESKKINHIIETISIIMKMIKKYNIEIIHSHHRMGAFYAQIIKIFYKKVRLVYTAHNVFYNKKILTQFSVKNTEIVAVGEGVKDNLNDYYNIQIDRINVINNSIKCIHNESITRPIECDQDKVVISCIGRISEQKGIKYLIKAVREVIKKDNNTNILVLIIGDGEKKEELIGLTNELSLSKYVKFLGYRHNVNEYIQFSDFIVSSSLWEGFPLTLIECFAEGKTVIASDIVGNNEIIEDGYNGFLFNVKDINELSDVIIKLSRDESLVKYLNKNAKDTYLSKFSFEKYIDRYSTLYKNSKYE